MTGRLALVVSSTTDDARSVVAVRLRPFLEAGWEARLFCKGGTWVDEPALAELGEHVHHYPKARVDSSPFDRHLRKLRPDLVHFHSAWTAWRGTRRGQLRDAGIVISLPEDADDLSLPEPERLLERADLLLVKHEGSLERAVERGCPRDRTEILEPPVPEIDWEARDRRDGAPLRIVSVGSMLWEQGYEHSVHAVRLLVDMGVPCEYRILGDGEHAQAVAFARHQLGLGDHVELLSPNGDDRLTSELGSADVFLDPAVSETIPVTALAAAQANGLPFVATQRGSGLPEGAGVVVPRRDPRAVAEALAKLARDPALRARMGREARRHSTVPTHADHMARLERLYSRVLSADAPR